MVSKINKEKKSIITDVRELFRKEAEKKGSKVTLGDLSLKIGGYP